MACVLVHTLIGIDADRPRIGEPERTARQHPILNEISREPVAQLELQHLSHPALRDVEHEEGPGDDAEDAELHEESRKVTVRQSVIERLVPAVEANLSVGGDHDDQENRTG